jgi:hypothetical protein
MGMSSLPGGTPENEQGRKDWAASFVAACVAKGVSVVGITDHHDCALVPYIQEAAEWSETPVIVYPGIEVTCSDNAQSIIIVDPGQADLLKKLLIKLPGVLPADNDDETTCEIQPTTWAVAELHAAISEDSVLQESCLFFPLFGNEGEHKTLNKAGHQTRFASLLTDGSIPRHHSISLPLKLWRKPTARLRSGATGAEPFWSRATAGLRPSNGLAITNAGSSLAKPRWKPCARLSWRTRRVLPMRM